MKCRPIRAPLAILGLAALACGGTGERPADALYRNAKIYTVDAERPWAEAMAVRGGEILAVGSAADLETWVGPDTQVHDLEGRMVMPGIHDTHMHPLQAGINERIECRFLSHDLDEVLATLRGCVAEKAPGEWVRGGQWNEVLFSSGRFPKTILDEIAPDNPVFLMDWSMHNAWVNSAALERFGIDAKTPDPNGGVIVRDPDTGEATGLLFDNATYERWPQLPEYSVAERADALAWSVEQIASYGVTTFREAVSMRSSLEAFAELERRGALPLRVKTSLSWKIPTAPSHKEELQTIEGRAAFASDRVDTSFAKIMLDGIPPTYTAALIEPYEPSELHGSEYRGKLIHDPAVLAVDVTALDAQGLTVKMHSTGDRSVRAALDAVEVAREANGASGLIHEVSHALMIHADDLPRFKALNVAAEMCPNLWYPIEGLDWTHWLGPERGKIWPVRSLVESGALVTYGSDWPVVPTANPWPALEAMVTRSDPASGGPPDWPEQAVDLATALQIFTLNSAVANKAGDRSGVLAPGRDADFIVLDRELFEVPITDVGETQVLLSVVGGVHILDRR